MNLIFAIFVTTIYLFGIGIYVRLSNFFSKSDFIPQNLHRKFQIIAFLFFLLIFFLKISDPLKSFAAAIFPSIAIIIFAQTRHFFLQKQISIQKIQWVRELSLKISSGMSILDAVDELCLTNDNPISKKIRHHVAFRQHFSKSKVDKSCSDLIIWLEKIIDCPVNAREKLKCCEEKLLIEHDFRRRSGQALLGIRIQALVMTILFLLGLIYSLSVYNFVKNQREILISVFLFLLGVLWILKMGGKIRWKV